MHDMTTVVPSPDKEEEAKLEAIREQEVTPEQEAAAEKHAKAAADDAAALHRAVQKIPGARKAA